MNRDRLEANQNIDGTNQTNKFCQGSIKIPYLNLSRPWLFRKGHNMKTMILTLIILSVSITCLAQVHGPDYWSEGNIRDYEMMIDDLELSCGTFLEDASLYILYWFDYWYYPPPEVQKHIFKVWTNYGEADFNLTDILDEVICDSGELLFQIYYDEIFMHFLVYDGSEWWWFGGAYMTNTFCMGELILTHRPPERISKYGCSIQKIPGIR
jgi:hypothetical protein